MIQRLIEGIVRKDAPVVVGLDPNLSFIPKFILKNAERAAGGGYTLVLREGKCDRGGGRMAVQQSDH